MHMHQWLHNYMYRQLISYMTSYSYTASARVKSAGNQSRLDEVTATLQPIAQTLTGQASTLIHTLDNCAFLYICNLLSIYLSIAISIGTRLLCQHNFGHNIGS